MAARHFISGHLKMSVSFNDRTDQYKVKICPTIKGERCETVAVGLPGSGPRSAHGRRLPVDDPRAMRNAAHAAISFAGDDIQEYATVNSRGSGWSIRPPRAKRSRR
jgi:hypothetical protein